MSLIGVIEKKIPDISDKTKELLKLFNDESLKGLSNNELKDFFEGLDSADEDFMKFVDKFDSSKDVFEQYQQHMIDNGKATSTFANFTKKAGTVLKSFGATLGSMAAMWAIGEFIGITINAISEFTSASDTAKDSADSLSDSIKTFDSSVSSNRQTLSNLNDRYQELSKGVSVSGKNISLTSDEYEEYKDIISQISSILPNLNLQDNEASLHKKILLYRWNTEYVFYYKLILLYYL